MIESVEEFLQLRLSQNPYEYHRAAQEETPLQIWLEAIAKHPEMKTWVAHNKDEKPAEASLDCHCSAFSQFSELALVGYSPWE